MSASVLCTTIGDRTYVIGLAFDSIRCNQCEIAEENGLPARKHVCPLEKYENNSPAVAEAPQLGRMADDMLSTTRVLDEDDYAIYPGQLCCDGDTDASDAFCAGLRKRFISLFGPPSCEFPGCKRYADRNHHIKSLTKALRKIADVSTAVVRYLASRFSMNIRELGDMLRKIDSEKDYDNDIEMQRDPPVKTMTHDTYKQNLICLYHVAGDHTYCKDGLCQVATAQVRAGHRVDTTEQIDAASYVTDFQAVGHPDLAPGAVKKIMGNVMLYLSELQLFSLARGMTSQACENLWSMVAR